MAATSWTWVESAVAWADPPPLWIDYIDLAPGVAFPWDPPVHGSAWVAVGGSGWGVVIGGALVAEESVPWDAVVGSPWPAAPRE